MSQARFTPLDSSDLVLLIWTRYENKIDGSKSSKLPLETGGGILADDMGLGKTLMMIAAISRTLEQAQEFVEQTWVKLKQPRPVTGIAQVPSRSSLVIVPTPCKL